MRRESRGHTARLQRPYGQIPRTRSRRDTLAHRHARTAAAAAATHYAIPPAGGPREPSPICSAQVRTFYGARTFLADLLGVSPHLLRCPDVSVIGPSADAVPGTVSGPEINSRYREREPLQAPHARQLPRTYFADGPSEVQEL